MYFSSGDSLRRRFSSARTICSSSVQTRGGNRPCRPRASRSAAVKAVPLLRAGLRSGSTAAGRRDTGMRKLRFRTVPGCIAHARTRGRFPPGGMASTELADRRNSCARAGWGRNRCAKIAHPSPIRCARRLHCSAAGGPPPMVAIIRRESFSETTFLWEVLAPDVARAAKAGHFVMLRLHEGSERIPLTVADMDPERGTITMVIQSLGKSTREMRDEYRAGDHFLD